MKDAQRDLDDLEKRVYAELSRLEDLSRADRDKAKIWYDRATLASYFLYTLGWGLGLVARLSGADDRGDEAYTTSTVSPFPRARNYLCNLSSGLRHSFGRLRARRFGPDADGAVSLSRIQPSRLLRAYFFCAFESQSEGSLATHSAAGMLNSGRTAKILASGPAADSVASASVRVFAAVTTNRTPS